MKALDKKWLIRGIEYGPILGVQYGLRPGLIYDDSPIIEPKQTQNATHIRTEDYGSRFTQQHVEPNSKVVVTVDESESKATLNFTLELLRRESVVTDQEEGEVLSRYYVIKIYLLTMAGKIHEFVEKVSADSVKDFTWVKKATYSMACIPSSREEKLAFQMMVQRCIETEDVPQVILYPTPGWRYISNRGWRFVYGDGLVGEVNAGIRTSGNKYHLNILREELDKKATFDKAMLMTSICKNKIGSLEILLFVHASVLETLFEEAGFPIHFVFGIVGVTNSRKTSLALAMGQIFDRDKLKADAEFATATNAGIEKVLSTYRDGCVIIDDFKPGVGRGQQKVMDQKLDELIRFYGNRVPKMRMRKPDPDSERTYYSIDGCCLVTMEIITGVLSSISRLFVTELGKDDVDNDCLGYFQENRWILPTHLYGFLNWITKNFAWVVNTIRKKVPELRAYHQFEFARYDEMYSTFVVVAFILIQYAKEYGYWDDLQAADFIEFTESVIKAEIRRMEDRAKCRDKGYLVLEAIMDIICRGKVSVYKLTEETIAKRENFYEDEKFFYVRTKELRKLVNEYAGAYKEVYEIVNDDELLGLLERLQVLEVKENTKERSRKLPSTKNNNLRYLYIKKDTLRNHLKE